ncbi:hypothetical protein Scep_023384 [Stephania cephalantha]|uniref:TsaA-like domain-containing protein n=1 Tax=Stephania cephalantha TaxID=152367 RepID=A0AAP0F3K1_9MAGN
MAAADNWGWTTKPAIAIAVAATSATVITVISARFLHKKIKSLNSKVSDLENQWISERRGRIRAQQDLRKALAQDKSDQGLKGISYPLAPIAVVQSCFSTRNGTPRQPLLVPLARACLLFDLNRVPPSSLEGLAEYSHCWIIYIFHMNTNLDKLWKDPSRSTKAKVRVPKLKGAKKGVFATRSPHRPCPIGLTVAKVEAVQGHMVLLSGVDLVDGTPVLDIKPYLPYCDSIKGAQVPDWVEEDGLLATATVKFTGDFYSALSDCWAKVEKNSFYASCDELERFIKQVLSWDIRSVYQRVRPHEPVSKGESNLEGYVASGLEEDNVKDIYHNGGGLTQDVLYHLLLESLKISYRIDRYTNVVVENISLESDVNTDHKRHGYMTWRHALLA